MHLAPSQTNILNDNQFVLPQSLSHYEIRACIESNIHTEVYEAWDTILHRLVLIRKLMDLEEKYESVLNQTRIAAGLTHSAFEKIHALEEQENQIYIVMELVQGKPLLQWIKENQGIENLALIHIKQTATALQEAYDAGMIHGDIKPEHFKIDENGKIRILNLVIAANFDPKEEMDIAKIEPKGSLAYLAPELFSEKKANSSSEIFSLGTILYQMLTGNTPYNQLTGLALVAAQAQTDSNLWAWPESISIEVKNLILGMTKRDYDLRLNWGQVQDACLQLIDNDIYSGSLNQAKLYELHAQQKINTQKRRRLISLTIAVFIVMLGIGIWQMNTKWVKVIQYFTSYSETKELERGMKALSRYDLPGNLETASEYFNNVLSNDTNNAKALAGMSLVYSYKLRSNRRDAVWRSRAQASAQQALSLNPELAITQIAYALSLDSYSQYNEAMAALKKAKKIDPKNLLAWQSEIRAMLMARKFEEVIQTSNTALQIFANDWLITNFKAVAYINQAQYKNAELLLRTNIEHHPDVLISYNYLATALDFQGKYEEALQVLQLGLQIRSDDGLLKQLGEIKFTQADYSGVENAMKKAILLKPQSYEYWDLLGKALLNIPGKEIESKAAFSKAKENISILLELTPNDGWLIVILGQYEARLGNFDLAKKYVERALSISQNNPNIHFIAACAFELIGLREKAIDEIHISKKLGFSEALMNSEPILKELRKDKRY